MYLCHKASPAGERKVAAERLPHLQLLPAFGEAEAMDVNWEESVELLEILEMDFDEVAILP